jgi:hypothetical protein
VQGALNTSSVITAEVADSANTVIQIFPGDHFLGKRFCLTRKSGFRLTAQIHDNFNQIGSLWVLVQLES